MAATALHEVRLDWSFQDTPVAWLQALVYRGVQQTWYAAVLRMFNRVAPAAFNKSAAGAKRLKPEPHYCGPSSKITNEFGIGWGRGRGLSAVGAPAGL